MKCIARGFWQQGIWVDLLRGREVENPVKHLRGRARQYAGRYRLSFLNMLVRAEEEGFRIKRVPGPRGGEWSAKYSLQF